MKLLFILLLGLGFTQIVGQGVATSYNPTLGWVGSLDNFSPGSGYWFKSNESLCFEYDCVED